MPLIQHIDVIPERAFTESPALFDEYTAPVTANAYGAPATVTAQIASPSAATGFVSPQFTSFAVEASASQVVGSFPAVDESAPPVYKQVHQEQIAAEHESLVRNSAPSDILYTCPSLRYRSSLWKVSRNSLRLLSKELAFLLPLPMQHVRLQ